MLLHCLAVQSVHGATVSSVSPAAMVFAQATEEQHSSQIPDLDQLACM